MSPCLVTVSAMSTLTWQTLACVAGRRKGGKSKWAARGRSAAAGRLYVGRWNERVRAKRCDAVDWGLLKRDSKFSYTLELRFLKNSHETPFYVNRRIFCCIFCFKTMGKGEFFRDENRTYKISRCEWVRSRASCTRKLLTLIKFLQESSLLWYRVNLWVSQDNA